MSGYIALCGFFLLTVALLVGVVKVSEVIQRQKEEIQCLKDRVLQLETWGNVRRTKEKP